MLTVMVITVTMQLISRSDIVPIINMDLYFGVVNNEGTFLSTDASVGVGTTKLSSRLTNNFSESSVLEVSVTDPTLCGDKLPTLSGFTVGNDSSTVTGFAFCDGSSIFDLFLLVITLNSGFVERTDERGVGSGADLKAVEVVLTVAVDKILTLGGTVHDASVDVI